MPDLSRHSRWDLTVTDEEIVTTIKCFMSLGHISVDAA
jgi:hypothetical protein